MCLSYLSVLSPFFFSAAKNVFFSVGVGGGGQAYKWDLLFYLPLLFSLKCPTISSFHSKMSSTHKNPEFFLARSARSVLID